MKTVTKLCLLAIALTLASCNEKVSPELQSGDSSTADPDATPIPPNEYYFAVVNSSPVASNFKLHKTGLGNVTKNCEVRNTSGLSNDAFRGNPTANDITCYFEAEELALYHSGMNFKIQASKNSCDYVGYSPYGYYNKIPGDSSGTYTEIECTEDANNGHVVTTAATIGLDISTASGNLGCGQWASKNIIPANRLPFSIPSDEDLCRFNYKDGEEEMCDIGVINVDKYKVSYTTSTDPLVTPVPTISVTSREIRCGGKVYNCVKGPTKEINARASKVTEIINTTVNTDFEKEYKYPGLMGTLDSTLQYVNYRRNLSNTNMDFINSFDGSYNSMWSDPLFGKTFEPRVMDFYAANTMLDGVTPLISNADLEAEKIRSNTFTAKPLAADPILGLAGRVNPFYTFYCYDTAFDMKARIRMVVRDWDRIFPLNSDLEYLSDLFRGANGRQDNPDEVEIPGDIDGANNFNDMIDWDDYIPMERTAGNFDPFTTIWKPIGTVSYPQGWYNPANFPHLEDNGGN